MKELEAPGRRRATWLLMAALLVSGAAFGAEGGGYAGGPLVDALRDLQARGLQLFFTSHLVRPEMRVAAEPTVGEPAEVLAQLLAPHGLVAVPGPGGRLVVVAGRPGPAEIRGSVSVRRSRVPLGGVRVLAPEAGREAVTGEDGGFRLGELEAGTYRLEAHLPGFVVERLDPVAVGAGETFELAIELEPAPMELDEIVVTPSSISLLRQEPTSALDLDRDDILALPHLGDDIFRALTLLPGVTGEETSARFNVRGGRADEVLVLLDRVELFEPYHMKDYSSSLSIIAPRTLREVNLITGGFPAQYGDRMSGVLDMSTHEAAARRTHLGIGILSAEAGSSGTFADERGHWLGSLRRGSLDLTLDFLGQREKPRYWDGFAKAEIELRPSHRLGVHVLHSDDALNFSNVDPDNTEDYLTGYGNSYAWLTHGAILGPRLFAEATASIGRVDRDRTARERELEPGLEGQGFSIFDRRMLEVAGLKQDWGWQVSDRHSLKWGVEARRLETDYDYFNRRVFEDDPLAELRGAPRPVVTSFQKRLMGEQRSAYVSDRLRLAQALTLELGLRYDRHTLTGDRDLSPRVNAVWATGPASALRLAWGYFHQSQRPYELAVEDGETELVPSERTEQRVVGWERAWRRGSGRDLRLRVEVYERRVRDPRVRYENVYEPTSSFPEIEADRLRLAPERSLARGLEVFVRGAAGPRVEWWASYAWSRVEDRIDGRDVPRRIDQPHALNLDLNYRLGAHWNLNLAWRYHTGWPTTAVFGRRVTDEDGETDVVPTFGPLNGERVSDYHRLDLRASREWRLRRGELGFFVEVQNLYDRENVAGFDVDFEFAERPDGRIDLIPIEEPWGGFLPSFGITWEL